MKVGHLFLPVLALSHDDNPTLLSLKLKVHSTLESGVDHLLETVGSRNVTQMSALLQNLVEETLSEEGPYELDGDVHAALDMIKTALLGDIRGALKEAHCQDQTELHENILCFEKCEKAKKVGADSCGSYCDGSAHKTCRDDLLGLYKTHIKDCRALDDFVRDFSKQCPEMDKKCCLLSHTTYNCGGLCSSQIANLDVDASLGTWINKQITKFENAHIEWKELHGKCTKAYRAYVEKDADCDCQQAECETRNCEWESCHYLNCEDNYNKCWGRCEGEYTRSNKAKECLEKDRKIDWSATEKIECYVDVLVAKPSNETLLATCGTDDCYNKWREHMYHKCNEMCVEVDFEGSSEHELHDRRKGKHADIDVTGEGAHSVRTKHRSHHSAESEKRCTSHLDLDYQLPPCCHPCEARPSPPCESGSAYSSKSSYMWLMYEQFGHFSNEKVLDAAECHSDEHKKSYAYNLCDCLDCDLPQVDTPAHCTHAKECDAEEYDYRQHDIKFGCSSDGDEVETTIATTTAGFDVPEDNCPTPYRAETCHFWGDPHFTHLFNLENKGEVKKGGRHRGQGKLFNFNPAGVFDLASSDDGTFEAQTFFCPYIQGTSTGAGLAMRFGEDLIQVVRGSATAPRSEEAKNREYWAVLDQGSEAEYTEFFVNGKKVSWDELGDATGTRGSTVQVGGGISAGSSFMQQMKTNHESGGTILPVCVGDGQDTLVEVGIPFLKGSSAWPMVYEHAVTIRSANPGTSGICSGDPAKIPKSGDEYRVPAQKILFSSQQMKSLCSMCRLDMKDGVCGAPNHDVTAEMVCETAGQDVEAAKTACGKEFDESSQWFSVCVMEACASGDGAVAISKIEAHLQSMMEEEETL